jgi:8-oxo-dGTP pyrophosphatase MutT (NUDIX family)
MIPTTLLFLVRKDERGEMTDICLAMKKRRFGAGKWNGVGGKVEGEESLEEALAREVKEEIGVRALAPVKMAEIAFAFPHEPTWDQHMHVYVADEWEGEPTESEEMRPLWFPIKDIPFHAMWPDDKFWLPHVLAGKRLRGSFAFGKDETILKQIINLVDAFE